MWTKNDENVGKKSVTIAIAQTDPVAKFIIILVYIQDSMSYNGQKELSPINFVPIDLFQSQWYLISILQYSEIFKRKLQIRYNLTKLISSGTVFLSIYCSLRSRDLSREPIIPPINSIVKLAHMLVPLQIRQMSQYSASFKLRLYDVTIVILQASN